MNRIQTNLFIGGEIDGTIRELSPGIEKERTVFIPIIPDAMRGSSDDSLSIRHEEYRRETLRAEDVLFDVWILRDMRLPNAMAALFANYRPEKQAVTP